MKLNQLQNTNVREEFKSKGYALYEYDREKLKQATASAPTWVHFGAGNIFRAFPAAVLQKILNKGEYDKGIIVGEGFDYEIINKAYTPYDSLSLLVTLKSNGEIAKEVIGSVVDAMPVADEGSDEWKRFCAIFREPSLQMVSYTITEKGYSFFANGIMEKTTKLLLERFNAGAYPIAMVSMDNCSHNGDKLKTVVTGYAKQWVEEGKAPAEFLQYLEDESKVSFPWSMIDKITPRPDAKVQQMLREDSFEDGELIITSRNTYTSAFVNAEEVEYLVIEDSFPNGRPPLELGGIYFADRETVDKVEKMKVCTCLNPLHTALAIYGCLLGYTLICDEMQDEDLKNLVKRLGYVEGLPVVVDPKIIAPQTFIDEVFYKRLPNPFMPDAPQRIATDTSQKLPIRFGETLKAYKEKGLSLDELKAVPLVIAGYLRYLMGVDDNGNAFEPSSDPLLEELQGYVKNVKLGEELTAEDKASVTEFLRRKDVFAVDLVEIGLADKIIGFFEQMIKGPGAVRNILK
ncbi:MAG: mannitol dehydrogenase family protein [Lachnospiraceae bacterium]|nr:mannitol dehydrogenase family protein [Lachnospiraceae bacterium]